MSLDMMVRTGMWRTPRANDWKGGITGAKGSKRKPSDYFLPDQVNHRHLWPTPTAITNNGGAALCKWGGSGAREKLKTMVTASELNGQLNPTWVEWLMGYPIGWTALEDSATPSSRRSRKRLAK
jgi:hypothetical protein